MKLKIKIMAIIATISVLALSLFGCVSAREVKFSQPNLMEKATAMANPGNIKGAAKAIDGNAGSAAKLDKPMRGNIDYDLGGVVEFNTMVLREMTDAVDTFRIYTKTNAADPWAMVYEQDRITNYRLCYLESQKARYIRIDFVKVRGVVKLAEVELYNMPRSERDDFRVTQYLVMTDKDAETGKLTFSMKDMIGNEGFGGNYDVVTDVMIINGIGIDKDANVAFGALTEQEFADNLADLRTIIGGRDVNIRLTMFLNPHKDNSLDAKLLKDNAAKVAKSVEDFTKKYNLTGIDYDWEYPQNPSQWKIYSDLIVDTAKFTEVSVALPTWGVNLTKAAKSAVKFVNLMTYDAFDQRGDHSNIFISGIDGINKMLDNGFKKEQICLGIPMYARTVDQSFYAWPSLVNYPDLGKWGNIVEDFEYKHQVDGQEIDRINTAYFNGYAMTRDKTALALAHGIGGVMLFRARCDAPYTYEFSCHRAVKDVMDNMVGNPSVE